MNAPPQNISEEMLNRARSYYYTKENAKGDQEAAHWLAYYRDVKTTDGGRIYAYNSEKGHYQREAEALLKSDLVKEFGVIANRTRVGEVVARAASLCYKDAETLAATTPPNLIPLENGVFDLNSNTLLPSDPKYFFTYTHPIKYDPNAVCPEITSFLTGVVETERDKEILLDIVALSLYRARVTRHFFVLVGKGHNGKSVYLNLVRSFLGKGRTVSLTPQALAEDTFAAAQLYDKHANLGADIPGGLIKDTAIIKAATGGDAVSVQRKGVDRDERELYCEFVWGSNEPPRFNEDTHALWDRLVVVMFPFTFVNSPKLPFEKQAEIELEAKLVTSQELSGLFNLAIQRLPRLLKKRDLSVKVDPNETREAYRTISDTPAVFIEEMCEEVPYEPYSNPIPSSGYLTAEEAYRKYKEWCRDKKLTPVSANKFGREVGALGFEVAKDEQQRTYRGLKFRERNEVTVGTIGTISPILPAGNPKVEDRIEKNGAIVPNGPTEFSENLIHSPSEVYAFVTSSPGVSFEEILSHISPDVSNPDEWLRVMLERLSKTGNLMENPAGCWRSPNVS